MKFFNNELQSISHFICYFLQNNGTKIYGNLFTKTVNKLEVLHIAKSLGLQIPDTYIFSNVESLKKIATPKACITKAISETTPIFTEDNMYLNYTKSIGINEFEGKNEKIIPTLLQPKIKVDFEIRAFFFETKIWAIATFEFSDEVDVRFTKPNQKKYVPYELREDIKIKIFDLAKQLKLNCGTIDLLKSDKDFYFLEVNPLGQFHEVSYFGKYEIEKYIADLL